MTSPPTSPTTAQVLWQYYHKAINLLLELLILLVSCYNSGKSTLRQTKVTAHRRDRARQKLRSFLLGRSTRCCRRPFYRISLRLRRHEQPLSESLRSFVPSVGRSALWRVGGAADIRRTCCAYGSLADNSSAPRRRQPRGQAQQLGIRESQFPAAVTLPRLWS